MILFVRVDSCASSSNVICSFTTGRICLAKTGETFGRTRACRTLWSHSLSLHSHSMPFITCRHTSFMSSVVVVAFIAHHVVESSASLKGILFCFVRARNILASWLICSLKYCILHVSAKNRPESGRSDSPVHFVGCCQFSRWQFCAMSIGWAIVLSVAPNRQQH